MTVGSDGDLAGLRAVGRVVALALREMEGARHEDHRAGPSAPPTTAHHEHTLVVTRGSPIVLTAA